MRIPDKQAIFFELDGVLVEEPRLDEQGRVKWLPDGLRALQSIDPRLFMVFIGTAREDIAFGKLREREFRKFCDAFLADCTDAEVTIRKIYSCPYHPKGHAKYRKDTVFRKPAPGIYKMAQQEFDLNLARCWTVGHRTADVLAGSRAGMGTVLVKTGIGGADGEFQIEPHREAAHVLHAVRQIHRFEAAQRC